MEALQSCEREKQQVKNCYNAWLDELWSGHFGPSDCGKQTEAYRQCICAHLNGMHLEDENEQKRLDNITRDKEDTK